MDRLPAMLGGLGLFLIGTTVSPFIESSGLRVPVLIAGLALAGLWPLLSLRSLRLRFPVLMPGRTKLSVLYTEVGDLRTAMKVARKEGSLSRSGWSDRMSTLDTKIFAVVNDVVPDDWRHIRRGQRSFPTTHEEILDDRIWGDTMIALLDERLRMLKEQLERFDP